MIICLGKNLQCDGKAIFEEVLKKENAGHVYGALGFSSKQFDLSKCHKDSDTVEQCKPDFGRMMREVINPRHMMCFAGMIPTVTKIMDFEKLMKNPAEMQKTVCGYVALDQIFPCKK